MATSRAATRKKNMQLANSLRIAIMRLTRRIRSEQSDEMLPLSLISVLITLNVHGPLTPSALAEIEHVRPSSMTRILYALKDRKLVLRQPHHSDGRASVVAISAAGQKALDEDRRKREAWLMATFDALTEEQVSILRAAAPILRQLSEWPH